MFELFSFLKFQSRLKKTMNTYNKLDDPWSAELQVSIIAEVLAELLPEKGSLLEVGCGQGIITEKLLPLCTEVTGIDISKEAIKKAQKRLPKSSELSLKSTDIHSMDLSQTFDTTLLSFIISYLGFAKHKKRFVRLMHKLTAHSKQLILLQPMNGPEDMQMIQAMQVILKQFGCELKRDFTREDTSPALYCAHFTCGEKHA